MRLRLSRRAVKQLRKIHEYLSAQSPRAASKVGGEILAAFDLIADFPHAGRAGARAGTREIVVSRLPYIIVYRLVERGDGEVRIAGIYHAAQHRPGQRLPDDDS